MQVQGQVRHLVFVFRNPTFQALALFQHGLEPRLRNPPHLVDRVENVEEIPDDEARVPADEDQHNQGHPALR